MPPSLRLRPILECRAVVQQAVIVNQLQIAGLKLHRQIERGIIRERVEEVQCFALSRRERRAYESASRVNVCAVVDG
jgi:hypothetical protein